MASNGEVTIFGVKPFSRDAAGKVVVPEGKVEYHTEGTQTRYLPESW